MKKVLVLVGLLVCFFASSSFALTLPTLTGSYEWSNADYWTITDLSSSEGLFELTWENGNAAYESSFGLYTVNSSGDSVLYEHEIFTGAQEPGVLPSPNTTASVWFSYDSVGGIWQISDAVDGTYSDFGLTFGFYSDVTSGGSPVDTWYTDTQFNTQNLERLFIAYDSDNHGTLIYLEDTAAGSAPVDLMISSSDLQPVPEPATLLLLGSGLVGLAFLKRRKS